MIVVGGGVAGLTAAHELLHRSGGDVAFKVVMFERRDVVGGKARSLRVPKGEQERTAPKASGVPAARPALPGEHGFRFFPGFYANTFETFKQIPVEGGRKTVFDRLVTVPRLALTRMNAPTVVLDPGFATTWQDAFLPIQGLLTNTFANSGVSRGDALFFAVRIWQILTSCQERRLAEYEQITWWDYVQAAQRSKPYQDLLAEGLSRSLLANDPRTASARTVGNTNVQLLLGILLPGQTDDHVLNGPTSETWLDPWREYLQRKFEGRFEVRCSSRVTGIKVTGSQIGGVWVVEGDVPSGERPGRGSVPAPRLEAGDCYLFAVPVERMAQLIEASATTGSGRLLDLDPSLEGILKLRSSVAAMNGVQFFMYRPLPMLPAHYLCVDSPWSLTAIAEGQFWKDTDLSKRGDGTVRDVLSVCISNWDAPGILYGRPANELSRAQIENEVWAQLKAGLNTGGSVLLRDEDVHSRFMDPDVVDTRRRAGGRYYDTEPLFVNKVDTWRLRPKGVTGIPNLFLASDYVQTNMDLACMEAANEAARTAVNGILELSGSRAARCRNRASSRADGSGASAGDRQAEVQGRPALGPSRVARRRKNAIAGSRGGREYGAGVAEIRREERRDLPPAAAFVRRNQDVRVLRAGKRGCDPAEPGRSGAQRVQLGCPGISSLVERRDGDLREHREARQRARPGAGVHARAVVRRLDSRRVDGGYPEVLLVLALHRGR